MFSRGISLADKCQLLFGAAVVIIMAAALVVPWMRLSAIVDRSQLETSRQIALLWSKANLPSGDGSDGIIDRPASAAAAENEIDLRIRYYPIFEWEGEAAKDPPTSFRATAKRQFDRATPAEEANVEAFESRWDEGSRVYRFAMVVHNEKQERSGVLVVERRSAEAERLLMVNRGFLVLAAVGAGVLAVLVFYIITTRIILGPVRKLRDTAEIVRAGNMSVRSEIQTGDEFEELSEAFNSMLGGLEQQQQQLRGINKTLDLKLTELAERNVSLYEAARLKGEFLARVSHELRTPLHAIIGFAELLHETAGADLESPGAASDPDRIAKRQRYLTNIVSAGRTLLEMINDLLAMARIDAGNIDVHVQEMAVGPTCEGLMALIKPLADKKSIRIALQLHATGNSGFVPNPADADLPMLRTDPKKFEQIVFNFLSNAVKFTPEGGDIILRAERLKSADGVPRLRVSVLDTGPGIPAEQQRYVFEKFTQLDGSRTREHQGTGLGLAIAKEFAELLQGEIQLVSEIGRGSMFSLIIPLDLDEAAAKEAASRVVGRVRERAGNVPAAT